MPQQKRLPLGLISLPNVDILVDPETNTFMELTDGEGSFWIDLVGRKNGRLVKKDFDDFFRRAHAIGMISEGRLHEILDARKNVAMPTIQQYKKLDGDAAQGKSPFHPISGVGKLRPH